MTEVRINQLTGLRVEVVEAGTEVLVLDPATGKPYVEVVTEERGVTNGTIIYVTQTAYDMIKNAVDNQEVPSAGTKSQRHTGNKNTSFVRRLFGR